MALDAEGLKGLLQVTVAHPRDVIEFQLASRAAEHASIVKSLEHIRLGLAIKAHPYSSSLHQEFEDLEARASEALPLVINSEVEFFNPQIYFITVLGQAVNHQLAAAAIEALIATVRQGSRLDAVLKKHFWMAIIIHAPGANRVELRVSTAVMARLLHRVHSHIGGVVLARCIFLSLITCPRSRFSTAADGAERTRGQE